MREPSEMVTASLMQERLFRVVTKLLLTKWNKYFWALGVEIPHGGAITFADVVSLISGATKRSLLVCAHLITSRGTQGTNLVEPFLHDPGSCPMCRVMAWTVVLWAWLPRWRVHTWCSRREGQGSCPMDRVVAQRVVLVGRRPRQYAYIYVI